MGLAAEGREPAADWLVGRERRGPRDVYNLVGGDFAGDLQAVVTPNAAAFADDVHLPLREPFGEGRVIANALQKCVVEHYLLLNRDEVVFQQLLLVGGAAVLVGLGNEQAAGD